MDANSNNLCLLYTVSFRYLDAPIHPFDGVYMQEVTLSDLTLTHLVRDLIDLVLVHDEYLGVVLEWS